MTRIRIDMALSVDGFVAGPDQSVDHPLGVGGKDLHTWQFAAGVMEQASTGQPVPDDATPDQRVVFEHFENIGAYVMGRNMFGGGPGKWPTDPTWDGWWGPDPVYHAPVFVLTHHAREPLVMEGGTTFTFVTEGPERALELAREAAGEQDIRIAGGGATASAYLALGVVDELQFHVSPVLLGSGERPFEGVDPASVGLEIDRVIASPLTTHIRYRVNG